MSSAPPPAEHWPLVYFGKLACRGDFLRSPQGQALIQRLDPWFSQTLTRLASDVRWKLAWDSSPALSFAVLGTRSAIGLAGQLRPSQDSSGRRFPFLLAAQFATDETAQWLGPGLLQLESAWQQLAALDAGIAPQRDYEPVQRLLAQTAELRIAPPQAATRLRWQALMQECSLGELEDALCLPGREVDLRLCVLALGILLQTVHSDGPQALDKGLCLPLPEPGPRCQEAIAFWTALVASQLRGHALELLLCLPQQSPRWLQLSFRGATPRALCAALHAGMAEDELIRLARPHWVEDCLDELAGLPRFAAELALPGLSLGRLLAGFEAVFTREGVRA